MESQNLKADNGYIAITTTIILSLVMLILVITLSSSALLTRFGTFDFSNKKISYFLARSCFNYARLQLSRDGNYSGNETIFIASYQCSILPIETSGSDKIIKARAQVLGATTNFKYTVDPSLELVSKEELTAF